MPVPKKGESQKDFISRCIPYVIDEGNAKDEKQAAAICYSIWKKRKKENSDMKEKDRILLHLNTELKAHYNLDEDEKPEFELDRCTMLVGDGTYNGVYFPCEELEKAFSTFEGKPINLNHSSEKVEDIVGYLQNVSYSDGKIKAKPIFDENTARYKEAMGYIKSRVRAGDIPNVSVGVWLNREVEENKETGETKIIARELEGDHLALVVHGACNPESGCGIGLSNNLSYNWYTNSTVIVLNEDDNLIKELEIEILKEKIKNEKIKLEEEEK